MLCNVYNDGSHFIATPKLRGASTRFAKKKIKTILDKDFDRYFLEAIATEKGYKKQKLYIRQKILGEYGNPGDELIKFLDKYIEDKYKVKMKNIEQRKKRFRRKAFLNDWNYFVTFTYDDSKQTEEGFRKSLRKTLSNFASRRGWRYMGVWEYGEKEKRLHFHALMFIPDGEMVSSIYERKDWSERKHKMIITHENKFFFDTYGKNDFSSITKEGLKSGKTLDYILKYITKTNEKIVYSRGIPSEFLDDIKDDDVAVQIVDFVVKYILFDNVYDDENVRVEKSVRLDFKKKCFEIGNLSTD
ncbi:MAG: hypothetical protein IJ437_04530 [Clostridia bacterium]|nr:hypothetical protein [Clostridia bacterium]